MPSCRSCKFFENGKCVHEEFDTKNSLVKDVSDYIDWRFDGDIQAKLEEVIENKLKLSNDAKESLIEDICNCIQNDLTDFRNLSDGELTREFVPSFDFCCKHYE